MVLQDVLIKLLVTPHKFNKLPRTGNLSRSMLKRKTSVDQGGSVDDTCVGNAYWICRSDFSVSEGSMHYSAAEDYCKDNSMTLVSELDAQHPDEQLLNFLRAGSCDWSSTRISDHPSNTFYAFCQPSHV